MCDISIDFVTGVLASDGTLQEIIVVGHSEDCPLKQEFAAPGGPPLARIVVRVKHVGNGVTRTEQLHLAEAGAQNWAIPFKGFQGACDDQVLVSAWCGHEGSDCGVEDEPHTIYCGCPSVTFQDPDYADCADGVQEVTLTAQWSGLDISYPTYTLWRYGANIIVPVAIYPGDTEVTAVLPVSNEDLAVSDVVVFELLPNCLFSIQLDGLDPCPSTGPCPSGLGILVKDASGTAQNVDDCLPPGSYIAEVTGENLEGASIAWTVDGADHAQGPDTIVTVDGAALDVEARITRDGCSPKEVSVALEPCAEPPEEEPEPRRDCPELTGLEVVADGGTRPVDTGDCLPPGTYVVRPVGTNLAQGSRIWRVDDQAPGNVDEAEVRPDGSLQLHLDRDRTVTLRLDEAGCARTEAGVSLTPCKEDPRPPEPPRFDPCLIWFWLNVGLMVLTGIVIFVTGCILDAAIQAAIAAIATSTVGIGEVIGVFVAALGALEVIMIIASIVLIILSLVSFIAWILLCLRTNWRIDKCAVMGWLIWILHGLEIVSGVAALFLLAVAIGSGTAAGIGCMIGAAIDFAYYSLLVAIAWTVAATLGCSLQPSPPQAP